MLVYLEKQAQFKAKTKVKALLFNKAFIKVLAKYSNYNNIFLIKNMAAFSEHIGINDYIIKPEKD